MEDKTNQTNVHQLLDFVEENVCVNYKKFCDDL